MHLLELALARGHEVDWSRRGPQFYAGPLDGAPCRHLDSAEIVVEGARYRRGRSWTGRRGYQYEGDA